MGKRFFRFAMTFNGYKHFGSFERCAAAATARRRQSLEDLRNELFFAARAARHRGDDEYLAAYEELLLHFRRIIEAPGA